MTHWCLISPTSGVTHRLDSQLMFVGRELCDIIIQCRTVEKQHAVIAYDSLDDTVSIKDTGTPNGTFVNDVRLKEHVYTPVHKGDTVRFGYDSASYVLEEWIGDYSGHSANTNLNSVPIRKMNGSHGAMTNQTEANGSMQKGGPGGGGKGTPLYGQPVWWGEENQHHSESKAMRQENERKPKTPTQEKPEYRRNSSRRSTKAANQGSKFDPPIIIYSKKSAVPEVTPPPKTPEHTEVTLVSANDKAMGFTIEFNAKEDSPKMARPDSLRDCMPRSIKEKMEESARMAEERKAARMKRSKSQEFENEKQSPRASPTSYNKLKDLWATSASSKRAITSPPEETHSAGFAEEKRSPKKRVTPNHLHPQDSNENGDDAHPDNVSETGTYTIESESHSKDVVEARGKIDEVFGVNGMMEGDEEEEGSDEDTDKDVSDEIEEEVVVSEKENGRTRRCSLESTPKKNLGGPGTANWVAQWASESNLHKPSEAGVRRSSESNLHRSKESPSLIRKSKISDGSSTLSGEKQNHKDDSQLSVGSKPPIPPLTPSPRMSSGSSTPHGSEASIPRSARGKRILPSTPSRRSPFSRKSEELLNEMRSSSSPDHVTQTESFKPSSNSAFHNPDEEPVSENIIQIRVQEEKSAPSVSKQSMNSTSSLQKSWDNEGSIDTEILLKDTETFMRNLEERMKNKKQRTPSPEISESYNFSHRSFDGDVDSDLDTASNVSLVGGNNSLNLSRSESGRTGSARRKSNSGTKDNIVSKNPRASPSPKPPDNKWSRLSQPNKHKKVLGPSPTPEKNSPKPTEAKENSDNSFKRNSKKTASLPSRSTTRVKLRPEKDKPEPKKVTKPVSKPANKPKVDLSKPRQTRSTMLRKCRFGEGDGNQSDLSPCSSLSDLSSVKASSSSAKDRRLSAAQLESNDYVFSDSDVRMYSTRKGMERNKSLKSTRVGELTARTDSSLGARIVRRARTQSFGDHSLTENPPSKSVNQSPKNLRSSFSSYGRKPQPPPSNGEHVNDANIAAYINTVKERRAQNSSSLSPSSSPKRISQSSETKDSVFQETPRSVEESRRSVDTLMSNDTLMSTDSSLNSSVGLSNSLGLSSSFGINRLRANQKETRNYAKELEKVPKEENTIDDILGEESVTISASQQSLHLTVPLTPSLQRSNSLDLEDEVKDEPADTKPKPNPTPNVFSQPIQVRRKQWNKGEPFDNLVLSSVNQLSNKLKIQTDRLVYKIKALQTPDGNPSDVENVLTESEIPLLKTENKEIANILQNMRKMEKRLDEIHKMIDPKNEIQLPKKLSSPTRRKFISNYTVGSASPRSSTSPFRTSKSDAESEEYFF